MKIERSTKRKDGKIINGKGYVLYGSHPDDPEGKWFERWFPTKEKAVKFCIKNQWQVEYQCNHDIKVICAWCKKVLKEGKEPVSHGICKDCRDKELKDLEKEEE